MKKLAIITAFVALICFGTYNVMANNIDKQQVTEGINPITEDPTPAITEFVKTYFPKANVLIVKPEWDEYEVRLSDGTHLEFTRDFEWKKIDCEHSNTYSAVPAELVPEQITTYVKTNFTNQSIIKIEKKRKNWEIELNSELEIKFNKNFVVTKIDD